MSKIWGFLRETTELAQKAGFDKDTGLIRTGLNEYLDVFSLILMIGYTIRHLGNIMGLNTKSVQIIEVTR